eukprot:9052961-Pyramimonas_sp.AAC.1
MMWLTCERAAPPIAWALLAKPVRVGQRELAEPNRLLPAGAPSAVVYGDVYYLRPGQDPLRVRHAPH